jgi:hypothetical protein
MRGCGIGCGILLLIVVVIGGFAYRYVSRTFEGIRKASESHEELVSSLGEIHAYVPDASGSIESARIELFLELRESLSRAREDLEWKLADFPPDSVVEGEDSFWKAFGVLKSLGDLLTPIGDFIDARNLALIEKEMGLGEYVYIYSLAYYSLLGHSPEDGPVFTKRSAGAREERLFSDGDSSFSPRKLRRSYRRFMLTMLRNQIESIPEDGAGLAQSEWRKSLASEKRLFESNPRRLVWEDGLPPALEASLAPFRDRLEPAYSPSTNCFELPGRELITGD